MRSLATTSVLIKFQSTARAVQMEELELLEGRERLRRPSNGGHQTTGNLLAQQADGGFSTVGSAAM
jgi:hypothetical protein